MKIIVGCPVAERAWILEEWFDTIDCQDFPQFAALGVPVDVEVVCLYTQSHDKTLDVLTKRGAYIIPSILPTRPYERITGHTWSSHEGEYSYMASIRNTLRKEVLLREADYFFSLDSDILLPHELALEQLLFVAELGNYDAVSPLVNMIQNPQDPPAYNYMLWSGDVNAIRTQELYGETEPFDVGVIMAAMLLNKKAQCIPWADHPQGEDIGWSLNARRSNLHIGVDPSIRCDHRMKVRGAPR